MKKMVIILLILSVLFLISCAKKAKQQENIDNPNFKLELLFEKDGCKMYRFSDAGRWIYWSNCSGSTQYDTGGKNNDKIQSVNN